MPRIEIRADYDCGHDSRTIAAGDVSVLDVRGGLTRMIGREAHHGAVRFNCRCGRGASFVVLLVDGQTVARESADKFLGIRVKR